MNLPQIPATVLWACHGTRKLCACHKWITMFCKPATVLRGWYGIVTGLCGWYGTHIQLRVCYGTRHGYRRLNRNPPRLYGDTTEPVTVKRACYGTRLFYTRMLQNYAYTRLPWNSSLVVAALLGVSVFIDYTMSKLHLFSQEKLDLSGNFNILILGHEK